METGGEPAIADNVFNGNPVAAINMEPNVAARFSGNSASGNGINGIQVDGGTMTRSIYWNAVDLPYVVTGDLKVGDANVSTPAIDFNIRPGAIMKLRKSDIFVNDSFHAAGTPDSVIVFTSFEDDSYAGDTNNDGEASQAAPGQWGQIEFRASSGHSGVLEHSVVRYGGDVFAQIRVIDSSPTIRNCVIDSGLSVAGLSTEDGGESVILSNNISNNLKAGVRCYDGSSPILINNTISENETGIIRGDANVFAYYNSFVNNSRYAVENTGSSDADFGRNYWGPATLQEMETGVNPKNIAAIRDNFDDSGLGVVDYTDWLTSPQARESIIIVSSPNNYPNRGEVAMKVFGWGFHAGAALRLTRPGSNDILGSEITVVDSAIVMATLDLEGKELGDWNVVVTNPDGEELVLPNGFKTVEPQFLPITETVDLTETRVVSYWLNIPRSNDFFATLQKVEKRWESTVRIIQNGEILASLTSSGDDIAHLENPQPGIYEVKVGSLDGDNAILRVGTSLATLNFDALTVRTIHRNDGLDWLQMKVPDGVDTLNFTLETVGNRSQLDIWRESFESSEHWSAEHRFNPPVKLSLPNPSAGTYYFQVYDHGEIPGSQARDYSLYAALVGNPIYSHDAVAMRIVSPGQVEQVQSVVTPQVMVRNAGTESDTIPVNLRIGSQYSESAEIVLAAGDSGVVSFPDWSVDDLGSFSVQGDVYLTTDARPQNDVTRSSVVVLEDINEPAVFRVSPTGGADLGLITVTLLGQGFKPGIGAKLVKGGFQDILALDTTFVGPQEIRLAFNLLDRQTGIWDVVATNPDGQQLLLPNAFEITRAGRSDVWIEIVGRRQIRAGRESKFMIRYGNSGNREAIGVPLWIAGVPANALVEPGFGIIKPPASDSTDNINWDEAPWYFENNGELIIALLIPRISPNSSGDLEILVTIPDNANFDLVAWSTPPIAQDDITNSERSVSGRSIESQMEAIDSIEAILNSNVLRKRVGDSELVSMATLSQKSVSTSDLGVPTFLRNLWNWYYERSECFGLVLKVISDLSGRVPLLPIFDWELGCFDTFTKALIEAFENPGEDFDRVMILRSLFFDCAGQGLGDAGFPLYEAVVDVFKLVDTILASNTACDRYLTPIFGPLKHPVASVNSLDPNEKVGPTGHTESQAISLDRTFQYLVYFENVDSATAAAQEIEILDTLDTDLDWSSLAFGNVQIGATNYRVIDSNQSFSQKTALNDTTELSLEGTFDDIKGIVRWYLRGTDTRDGGFGDFLPPNVNPPEGDGYVSFTIQPKPILLTGTDLQNRASIIFDVNPPILTNTVSNVIDAAEPTSTVKFVSDTSATAAFQVHWSGSDNVLGSGVKNYSVYSAVNGGPYELQFAEASDTSGTMKAEGNHFYWFYSVASDSVHNLEKTPDSPDLVVWNAGYDFSTPGLHLVALSNYPGTNSPDGLFASGVRAFGWLPASQSYEEVAILDPNTGYWLNAPHAGEQFVVGPPLNEYTKHLSIGWHLIGGVVDETDISDPSDDPDGSVVGAYHWDPLPQEYVEVTSLLPNQGYWVGVIHEADLTIGKKIFPKRILTAEEKESLTTAFHGTFGDMPPAAPDISTGVESDELLPKVFRLHHNYPNPFNATTTIQFQLPEPSEVTIKIYNILGQVVRTLVDKKMVPGHHRTVWNGQDDRGISVASGLYFFRLRAGEFKDVKKMLLLK